MAIAFQAKIDEQAGTTVAVNVGTMTNGFLLVSIMMRSGTTISVTYGGVSMTQLANQITSLWSATDTLYQFVLKNPTAGSNNVVITQNGTLVRWCAAWYSGVNQTTPTANAGNHQSNAAAAQSISVTPSQTAWIVGSGWINTTSITADANTTWRTDTVANGRSSIFDSNANKSSAYAIGYSTAVAGDLCAFALIPDSVPNGNFLMFM